MRSTMFLALLTFCVLTPLASTPCFADDMANLRAERAELEQGIGSLDSSLKQTSEWGQAYNQQIAQINQRYAYDQDVYAKWQATQPQDPYVQQILAEMETLRAQRTQDEEKLQAINNYRRQQYERKFAFVHELERLNQQYFHDEHLYAELRHHEEEEKRFEAENQKLAENHALDKHHDFHHELAQDELARHDKHELTRREEHKVAELHRAIEHKKEAEQHAEKEHKVAANTQKAEQDKARN